MFYFADTLRQRKVRSSHGRRQGRTSTAEATRNPVVWQAAIEALERRALLSTATITPVGYNPGDPIEVIEGQAIHVNALSSFSTDDEQMNARIEWNFGDVNGPYNSLTGFNAAHVYDVGADTSSGGTGTSYTISLKVTDPDDGTVTNTSLMVNVKKRQTSRTIYVSGTNGSDGSDGSDSAHPVQTISRVNTILANLPNKNNVSVLFERGISLTTNTKLVVSGNNMRIADYGSATNAPVLIWNGANTDSFFDLGFNKNTMVENLQFSASSGSTLPIVLIPTGPNTVMRNCIFQKVYDGVLGQGDAALATTYRFLAINNRTTDVNSVYWYGFWVEGHDLVYLGNHIHNSFDQHAFRTGATADNLLVAGNFFENPTLTGERLSGVLEIQGGSDVYVVGNRALSTPHPVLGQGAALRVGPRLPDETTERVVVEGNEVDGGEITLHPASYITVRGNVVHSTSGAFNMDSGDTDGFPAPWYSHITVANNTFYESSNTGGPGLVIQKNRVDMKVLNNLWVSPSNNSGAAVNLPGQGFTGVTKIDGNVWETTSNSNTDGRWHVVVGSTITDYTSLITWNGLDASIGTDAIENGADTGVTATNFYPNVFAPGSTTVPNTAASFGHALAEVPVDFYGRPFRLGDNRSAGAVEARSPANLQREAEIYDAGNGVTRRYGISGGVTKIDPTTYATSSGAAVGSLDANDYVKYDNIDFGSGVVQFTASLSRGSGAAAGSSFQLRLDSPTGTLIGTLSPTATTNWNTFTEQSTSISGATGVHDLYIVATGSGTGNLDYFRFSSGFTSSDIGSGVATGSTTELSPSKDFDITGGGTAVGGTADSFRFVYKQLTGNFDISVRVASLPNTISEWSKAGLMARSSLAADAANAFVKTTPGTNGLFYTARTTAGGTTASTASPAVPSFPNQWLRLQRSGTSFTAYRSTDGTSWTTIGSYTISSAPSQMYVGLVVVANKTASDLVSAQFRDLTGL